MASITVGYSTDDKGWKSFFSYHPDWGTNLNNSMYTFKYGELYKHDSNAIRNAFYWDYNNQTYFTYPSTITVVLNDSPMDTKDFRTISLDSNDTWDTVVTTDLATGLIDASYYVLKEGNYYSYIRRDANSIDLKATSTQGVGLLGSYNPGTQTLSFTFTISADISAGDKVYVSDGTSLSLSGTVGSFSGSDIVLSTVTSAPSPGDMIVVVKDSTAESYGARGYYMEVEISNSSTAPVEIFSISSELSRSMP